MKLEELETIETRVKAASPGPWSYGDGYEQSTPGPYIYSSNGLIIISEDNAPSDVDIEFIKHAKEDCMKLIQALKACEARVKELEEIQSKTADEFYMRGWKDRNNAVPYLVDEKGNASFIKGPFKQEDLLRALEQISQVPTDPTDPEKK